MVPTMLFRVTFPIALIALSVGIRWIALEQTPYANGWDAYYYLIQLKSWVGEGRMHSPDASLIYPLLRALYALLGDEVLAYKVMAAGLAGAYTGAVYAFGLRVSAGNRILASLMGAWTVFSPMLTWFCAQHPKNLLGLLFFTGFAAYAVSPQASDRLKALGWMALSYLGHRLALGMVLGMAMLHAVRSGWRAVHPRRALLVVGFVAVLLAGLMPGLLHWRDAERFVGVFSVTPQPAWLVLWRESGSYVLRAELLVVALTLAMGLWRWRTMVRYRIETLYVVFAALFFPFVAADRSGLGWRLLLSALMITPLLWVGVFASIRRPIGLAATAGCLIASLLSWRYYAPQAQDPPYARYEQVAARAIPLLNAHDIALVIAHNSLAEFFTFHTGVDAMPWIPEYPVDSSKLWRISAGVMPSALRRYMRQSDTLYPLTGGYGLLRESAWQSALYRADAEGDTLLAARARGWENPARVRPAYLAYKSRQTNR